MTGRAAPDAPSTVNRRLYHACRAGRMPAEALPAPERERLWRELCALGWTDIQIAAHTSTTLHTTARIRENAGLPANRPRPRGGDHVTGIDDCGTGVAI